MARWRRSESLVVPRSETAWGLLALFFPAVGRAIFFEGPLRAEVFRAVFFRAAFFVRFLFIYPLPFSHSIFAFNPRRASPKRDPA
jgi:hypothetical protein